MGGRGISSAQSKATNKAATKDDLLAGWEQPSLPDRKGSKKAAEIFNVARRQAMSAVESGLKIDKVIMTSDNNEKMTKRTAIDILAEAQRYESELYKKVKFGAIKDPSRVSNEREMLKIVRNSANNEIERQDAIAAFQKNPTDEMYKKILEL